MEPLLKKGDKVLVFNWAYLINSPKTGDLVVARVNNRLLIKRIHLIKGDQAYLIGDNQSQSTDSREFGFVGIKNIVGKVIISLCPTLR